MTPVIDHIGPGLRAGGGQLAEQWLLLVAELGGPGEQESATGFDVALGDTSAGTSSRVGIEHEDVIDTQPTACVCGLSRQVQQRVC